MTNSEEVKTHPSISLNIGISRGITASAKKVITSSLINSLH